MIKIIFCLRRLPGMSRAAFQTYWLEQHAPLVRQVGPVLGIRRYVQSHSLTDDRLAGSIAVRGGVQEPFDGVAELWWENAEAIIAAGATPAGREAGMALLADERKFIDLPNSPIFYSREHEILTV